MTLVVLKLGKGNWQKGFDNIKVQLCKNNNSTPTQKDTTLPPNLKLSRKYQDWQKLYQKSLKANYYRNLSPKIIFVDDGDDDSFSDQKFKQNCEELKTEFNLWLDSQNFQSMENFFLRTQLAPEDKIRFVIETDDKEFRFFPWHLWRFFDDYQYAEIGLSSSKYTTASSAKNKHDKVRILAVLGDSEGIDIEQDKNALGNLFETEIVFTKNPSRSQLNNLLYEKKGWDIFFFTGHSHSDKEKDQGNMQTSSQYHINPDELKFAFKKAVNNGLQLAIFNSCDGLGLAKQLAELHLAQMIVMRFDIHDFAAQEFLKYFLQEYISGNSLYISVREARQKLHGLENEKFPYATSWLPVICCQNPYDIPPTWQDFIKKVDSRDQIDNPEQINNTNKIYNITKAETPSFPVFPSKTKLGLVLAISLIISLATMGVRWLGFLQGWELKAFDFLMRHQPSQPADNRLVIIGADEEDIRNYRHPLPDDTLLHLLQKLQSYQPRAIGIDIFRDQPIKSNEEYQKLTTYLTENQNIVTVCNIGNELNQSIAPPKNVNINQVGYADLYDDSHLTNNQDDIVRRYLLSRSSNTIETPTLCQTDYSLGWHLAHRYLINQNIKVGVVGDSWQFGEVVLKPLQNRSGGYQKLDARGNQLLINYRNMPQIAQQLTLRDVLAGEEYFNPNWIKDRIVLIGMTTNSLPDVHDTPLGEIRGIYVHSHVVSQILDAVESGGKNLIWWLPQWGDFIFICFWATTGSLIIAIFPKQSYQIVGVASLVVILIVGCWWAFNFNLWLPVIPSVLALLSSGIVVGVNQEKFS